MARKQAKKKGMIAWLVHNRVTPNLLMIILIAGGFLTSSKIQKEVFPEFELDIVSISVPYPGASPEEVETGIILAVEDSIQGLNGIKEYSSTASEGSGHLRIELQAGVNQQKIFQDIQQEVDRITTFPDDAEDPEVSLVSRKIDVIRVSLYGDVSEHVLREFAEHTKDRLLQNKGISQVEIVGGRNYEVSVEISQQTLRRYNLTLADVADIIKKSSLELPGGKIKTTSGELLLRIKNLHDWAHEFSRIPVITTPGGTIIYLEDIATVSEAFEDSDKIATFNGKPSIALDVARVGNETPVGVATAVKTDMKDISVDYPASIQWDLNKDHSKLYKQRLELLLKNALIGLVLVLILLGTFLDFRLACWVTMGIPISFLGALLFLPQFDISINMISMFAFIIALGIVVDDAIIAGENIYEYRQKGLSYAEAAIKGAQDVAVPITFAILTNIVAFMPLLFVPGAMGKVWKVIPLVVITIFVISWIEALFILPSHLAHGSTKKPGGVLKLFALHQRFFSSLLNKFIDHLYTPALTFCLNWRGITTTLGIALFICALGYIVGGRISMTFMPRVESDRAVVTATLPLGTPLHKTIEVRDKLEDAINKIAMQNGDDQLVVGIFTRIDENEIEINAYLAEPDVRALATKDVTDKWREEVGQIVGLQSILFESDRGGPGSGAALSVELSHRDIDILDQASNELAGTIEAFASTSDVSDGFTAGKEQLDFQINAAGQSLGMTANSIAKQIRNSYQGITALKKQRNRNEVTVRVRLPEEERLSEFNIETMMIRTPHNTFVPLLEVTDIQRGRAYTTIQRRDGRRIVKVTANVEPIGKVNQITASLNAKVLPKLAQKYPGLTYSYKGRQADRQDSMKSMYYGFIYAMMAIYALLAIPFRSYIQPLVVMFAIPFGLIGALAGHILMGYNLSVISMMGLLALSGVVVNDSLVLIDYANKKIATGHSAFEAIRLAAQRRFRPIMLTTFTTFGGLAPMIFESSRQARFLIPMAISLGFGILFVTMIALLLVPCFFLILEDLKTFVQKRL